MAAFTVTGILEAVWDHQSNRLPGPNNLLIGSTPVDDVDGPILEGQAKPDEPTNPIGDRSLSIGLWGVPNQCRSDFGPTDQNSDIEVGA